ncbi:hypothetical protein BBJ28_00011857 [Nothophytophthora sp. Chile5]|nr:hypothetical protein BBJ28_00011857 [Nothophytophthora sp. Chile5]
MKRAVQEARELKKELVLLRQEKEQLRAAAQKNVVSTPGSGRTNARPKAAGAPTATSDVSVTSSNKAVELKLKQQIRNLTAEKSELESSAQELQQKVSQLEQQKKATISQATAALAEKQQEVLALQDELNKLKQVADETKRKCQKMLRDKREETQRALQENEQLARCTKTLQSQLGLLPQLKKQLEHANEKRVGAAESWQKKLEQRDQAFLREEAASKRKEAESATQISQLQEEKHEMQERLEDLELQLRGIDGKQQASLRHEAQLAVATKRLQEELSVARDAVAEAERAQDVARETQLQETRLRQLAEAAADAVEVRAEKAEHELARAQTQLERLEEALRTRGVTLDYLLRQQTPVSVPGRPSIASKSRSNNASTKTAASASTRNAASSKPVLKTRHSAAGGEAKALNRKISSSNNNDERDEVPERSRRS